MKARVLLMVALTLVMAGSLSVGPAAAGEAVVPFKASITVYPTGIPAPPCLIQTIPGVGKATHLGKTTFYSDAVACFHDMSQQGTLEFTAADGDQLFGYFEGEHSGMPPGEVTFWGDFWITGGTGRFEGATGTGSYWGSALPNVAGILYFDGILIK